MRDPILNVAIQAAMVGGNLLARAIKRLDKITITEKSPRDFVTNVDKQVESEIIAVIQKAFPAHNIIAEESGEIIGKDSDYTWIIDPLDGTRNFIHGFPHFAISIAIRRQHVIEHGLIYDPIRQELFTATRGKGAQLNAHRIRVNQTKSLEQSLMATGFAFRHLQNQAIIPFEIFQTMLTQASDLRRTGSAALDLAYIACGRLDIFWEFGLHLWDFAAGILLVKEAGGFICDPAGGEEYFKTGNLVAANPQIMRLFLKTIQPLLKAE